MFYVKGDGLGKNSDGIKEALRPKRKSNVLGFGYKLGSDFKDNWWENVYDTAASNVVVKTNKVSIFYTNVLEDRKIILL